MNNHGEKISYGPPRPPLVSAVDMSGSSYINKGLEKWEHDRSVWRNMNIKKRKSSTKQQRKQTSEGYDDQDIEEIIDIIVTNRWRTINSNGERGVTFPSPISLNQMVEILVDVWESED